MILKKRFWYFLGLLGFILLASPEPIQAQQTTDISTIKVDELSDEQVEELLNRASEAGLSAEEFLQMAQLRGMPSSEVAKLRNRIEALDPSGAASRSTNASKRDPRQQVDINNITQGIYNPQTELVDVDQSNQIFGNSLFYQNNRRLSFEPSLNQATPKSYVLGPGDVVYVDIYGQSEQYYEATVNPDGFVLLDNIGPVSVSGKTIEEATGIIKNRVSRFYTGLNGANPNTFIQVTLGNVRTIKVHILGEVRLPGTFTLSAFSTVFNALYAAGGPNENGTMREIKVVRNNKSLASVDVYDLLINGTANLDIQLQDQDVILVTPFISRVQIKGEVKRPMKYEVKEGDTFKDLVEYSGGFTDLAFKDRVAISRITDNQRSVSDVYQNQFGMFILKGGDEITVGKILDRYSNRVQIKGAVYREGTFALEDDLTLKKLIQNADGLRGDAYTDQASILRTKKDLSTEMIEVNLKAVLDGTAPDITLQREDVVRISSIYDIRNEQYVQILGEVKKPGVYPFSESMTVEELVISAGGFQESANPNDIEIARRLEDADLGTLSDIIPVQVNPNLSYRSDSKTLLPYDQVIVRKKASFTMQKLVAVEGQVNSPGMFAIQSSDERISDLINRAGGINQFAYAKGATLIRRTEFFNTESEEIRRQRNLEALRLKLMEDPNNSEAQEELIQRLFTNLPKAENPVDNQLAQTKKESLDQIASETPGFAVKIKDTEAVAIDLEAILKNPGSENDLLLVEGDILSVPKLLQTVRMRGDVVYPTTMRHESGRSLKHYINGAGGFERRANRKQTYVVYANGAVKRTKGFLGIRNYPPVEPGAEVIVPTKGPKVPLRLGDVVGITTGLATLALVVSQINW
ncbi:SLBB domain-containing protein [Algoriphagus zhangzhouensis]|uniref:Protein involved in polysaccharide export, contains SLBB domain of the beta-grasp fold n=1 Tax=Algoriphagus zhangzhouensis TaxID=1073327 RepID=A0A1M7ZAT9_9BACT|nr:SLBB domain-containing protein [Algoriphagus zhangzhouensis]TDY47010.1 protein involved in polysaccharide export with SLBB domain [Algoriphagus zhangzhouensis]SHO62031.1 protein involved in polysaccharide export, contains SLBB domain of the beta-grasp fold [Algoriphagus zhangzhouensis]